jgi:hypothetical protein
VFAYAGGVMPAERLQDADIVFDDMRDQPRLLFSPPVGAP